MANYTIQPNISYCNMIIATNVTALQNMTTMTASNKGSQEIADFGSLNI